MVFHERLIRDDSNRFLPARKRCGLGVDTNGVSTLPLSGYLLADPGIQVECAAENDGTYPASGFLRNF
ncbi:hypothetical protein HNR37_000836 [Desulfurispira natronophila]|uniref:Uncharacterized protein n=1 Tax=Desulfurispira natronophila TaxID=682562 RepID=A0A7W8DGM3_9BACT|nr:hypothetical protein [Desulfurispira natronophila]